MSPNNQLRPRALNPSLHPRPRRIEYVRKMDNCRRCRGRHIFPLPRRGAEGEGTSRIWLPTLIKLISMFFLTLFNNYRFLTILLVLGLTSLALQAQDDQVINTPVTTSGTYQAANSITATSAVTNNIQVTYKAGNRIVLGPGFSVSSAGGGTFNAILGTVDPVDPGTPSEIDGGVQAMALSTQSDGEIVRLRWSVEQIDGWKFANANGYTISRMTRSVNGQRLTLGEQAESRTVLVDNYRPTANGNWPTDDLSDIAQNILYSSDWDVEITDFASAVAAQESEENRIFFAHMIADRDFLVATNLALGYVDNSAVDGLDYYYVVTVNNSNNGGGAMNAGAEGGLGQTIADLPMVHDLRVENGDTTVGVGWSVAGVEEFYVSYDVYRAPAGTTNFVKATEAPFVYGTDQKNDPKYAIFYDSIATYGDYDYYVVGNTPFNFTGPVSETISASSRPAALNLIVRIDEIVSTETSLTLNWPSVTDMYNSKMVAQRVYRAPNVKGPYEVISPTSLGVAARQWTDPDPLVAAYYAVELEDENGHRYQTQPQLGQLEDRTPPATPSGFAAVDEGNGSIELRWDGNTEDDLKGYRLLRCYARGGDFAVVNVDILTDTTFTDNLDGVIVNDSIFYRLLAEDGRANASPKTPVLVVPRVDITPPGRPVLASATPTPEGVAVKWEYSADDDVVRHELQRRITGTGDWVTVVTVPAGEEDDFVVENFDVAGGINYVDDSDLLRGSYDYQFLAFDDADLNAGSEIVTFRPYDSGERGEIQDMDLRFACADTIFTSALNEAVDQNLRNLIDSYEEDGELTEEELKATLRALEMNGMITASDFEEWAALSIFDFFERVKEIRNSNAPRTKLTNCSIVLEWSYPIDATIQHFQILRSRKGSRLKPYKALPLAYFFEGTPPTGRQLLSFEDADAETGARYVYKVVALHVDGGYSQEGGGVTVLVE